MSTDNNQSGSALRRARSIAPEAIAPLPDRIRAWLVHIFTMSGMAFAALAMLALINQEIAWMWLWLGIALIVDGVDGYFARRYKVRTCCRGSTAGSSISRSTTSRGRSFPRFSCTPSSIWGRSRSPVF